MSRLHQAMEQTFRSIYLEHSWFHGSGSGSLPENTEVYRAFLQNFLQTHNVKTVLDLGCGDWQSTKFMDWRGIDYLGIEIVPDIVEEIQKRYVKAAVRFACDDITECELPPADLVIVKDVLRHWPNAVISAFLRRLKPYRLVLITDTIESQSIADTSETEVIHELINHDIKLGGGRPLDLLKPPFNLDAQELLRYVSVKPVCQTQDVKSIVLLESTK